MTTMIEVRCPQCGLCILVPEDVRGRTGICFGCGQKLQVPQAEPSREGLPVSLRIGDRVSDRYTVRELVGRGGMGVVYRAFDTLLTEEVALKFMKPQSLRTQKGRQLFVQEAQLARRLRHENIVAVHDVGLAYGDILYISMELIEGQSLRDLLNRHRQKRRLVDVRLALRVADQILAALDYAHRTVIHRDIKPENVMLLSGERAKVLDFGLAKALHEENKELEEAQKQGGRVVGTRAYASPEQMKHQSIDLRADLFSVGLVLRELLTLRTPVDEPVEIPEVRNDVAPSLLVVLDKALQRDKDRRWQSAREFRQHLAQAFENSYRPVLVPGLPSGGGPEVSTEDMIYLEGGSFLVGDKDIPEAAPEFETFVEPFYMDVTPVTVSQYANYMEATGAPRPKFWGHAELSGPAQPVVGVSWDEANAYAAWAGKQLPTEIQWEFAARGKENRPYPWGKLPPDPTRCNFRDYLGMPSIVTMHEEGMTPEGIKDMGGNVFEWCLDPFVAYGADRAAANVPLRVVRGGSWHSPPKETRCAFRKGLFPESQITTVGFRCVLPARREWRVQADVPVPENSP